MLKESKITLTVSALGVNSVLGVSINELLKIYLFNGETGEEIGIFENLSIENLVPVRKKTAAEKFNTGTQSKFDRRSYADSKPTTIDKKYSSSYTNFEVAHINQHLNKLVSWKQENQYWWEEAYKRRIYIIKNQTFSSYVNIVGAFSSERIWRLDRDLHMNQFCDFLYWRRFKFPKYKDLFWLACSIEGKNPEETGNPTGIFQATKAKFKIKDGEKEITYFTLSQVNKAEVENTTLDSSNKEKFVVYDYSEEWWNWSYEYRWQKDKADETSAYPQSEKFKNVKKGWDEQVSDNTSLNKICKDFYTSSSTSDQKEIEDAWRYCSDVGSNS
ncbi:hypothetical protein MHSWG343_10030 [Candidatus Mycoplasma haematohominis]|uniref:Uncharacterized protein n=1 Tax=Candidatus Mycoplasma haematohominis TaxID=1494318 RepID=A0A478FV41_9MOLU|nr:hypothetical protein MHSWG343_10030 [Candidatus Mycoplasma haemohominis]